MIQPLRSELARYLRTETIGGAILLVAAAVALLWVNSPLGESYAATRDAHLGPLAVGEWTRDGLLAVFFFVAGLELKRELVVGELADPKRALLPVIAAAGGVLAAMLAATTLAVGQNTTCTAAYTLTQADIDAGTVTNTSRIFSPSLALASDTSLRSTSALTCSPASRRTASLGCVGRANAISPMACAT